MKVLSVVFFVVAATIFAQSPAPLRFEVASIKPAADFSPGFGGTGFSRISPGGRLTIEMSPVAVLISSAYGLRNYQILGGPDWINTARFNIEAKAEENTSYDETNLMMRSLLEDRFKLKSHRESREFPLYQLVVAKGGPKIKLSADQDPPHGGPGSFMRRGGALLNSCPDSWTGRSSTRPNSKAFTISFCAGSRN
jgi:uncharacterized protein (TIGR03435 family)